MLVLCIHNVVYQHAILCIPISTHANTSTYLYVYACADSKPSMSSKSTQYVRIYVYRHHSSTCKRSFNSCPANRHRTRKRQGVIQTQTLTVLCLVRDSTGIGMTCVCMYVVCVCVFGWVHECERGPNYRQLTASVSKYTDSEEKSNMNRWQETQGSTSQKVGKKTDNLATCFL